MFNYKSFTGKYIDHLIFFFIVIFLLSLSNSIFVNQLGYYGALILILIKAAVNKENPFSKTGLEFALIWYISALILSTIFSSDSSASFNNLLKRVLLIPIIFTIIASVKNFNDAKKIFLIYIAGTLITVFIYLYFSFQYFIKDLYGVQESGPSVFQYPITASEILSFTVIFLFAFLINEKTSLKNKIYLFIGFSLSLLALFSTYKRTGWMGAAFGILVILIIKKQWKIILPGLALISLFLVTQKNISEVKIYSYNKDDVKLKYSFSTGGKAFNVNQINSDIIVSDYDNGLLIYKDSSLSYKIDLPYAVKNFTSWKDDYYVASLSDTRFILMKQTTEGLKVLNEFYSPGYTANQASANGYFYVLDKDSGLSIYTNPADLMNVYRYPQFVDYIFMFADSTQMILGNIDSGFVAYQLKNGLPVQKPVILNKEKFNFIYYSTPYLFLEDNYGLNIFNVDSSGLQKLKTIKDINGINQITSDGKQFGILAAKNAFYILEKNEDSLFTINLKTNFNYKPVSIKLTDDQILTTRVESKQSRLLGMFDPYHQSNFTRLALWQAGIKIFIDHPIFGVGDIDLANYYKQYKKPHHKEIQGHLHNNFFHVLATLGLFGLLAVMFLLLKIIMIDWKIFKQLKDTPFASSYALGALAAFCGFIVSGLTELNFWDHEITTLIWFTFGLNVAFFRSAKPEKKN